MKNIKNEGKAVAFVRTMGDHCILGLLGEHYLSKMKTNADDSDYVVTMPKVLTVYVEEIRIPREQMIQEFRYIANSFGVTVNYHQIDSMRSSGDTVKCTGLIFFQ